MADIVFTAVVGGATLYTMKNCGSVTVNLGKKIEPTHEIGELHPTAEDYLEAKTHVLCKGTMDGNTAGQWTAIQTMVVHNGLINLRITDGQGNNIDMHGHIDNYTVGMASGKTSVWNLTIDFLVAHTYYRP